MNLTLELSGLNLERLLRAAGACGVRMQNVRRDGRANHARRRAGRAERKRMAALCGQYGWQMAEIRAGGLLRLARGDKKAMDARALRAAQHLLGLSVLPK